MYTAQSRDPLDAERLRGSVLTPSGMWRHIDVVEETGSTNADLLARAAAGEDIDGSVLVAEYQTAGRGRHGRHWTAPPRSQIAISVGVGVAEVRSAALGWLPLLAGVAVIHALSEAAGVRAGLKWPNDVLVGDAKLAGILAEVASSQPVVVVGLGLNVSMTADEAPDTAATSLVMQGATVTDRSLLTEAVLRQLAARVSNWRRAGETDTALAADYRASSVTLGKRVRAVLPGDRIIEGVAADIDEWGRLRIATGSETVIVAAGDITHLRAVTP